MDISYDVITIKLQPLPLKQPLKTQKNINRIKKKLSIKVKSISVFLNIRKVADFR